MAELTDYACANCFEMIKFKTYDLVVPPYETLYWFYCSEEQIRQNLGGSLKKGSEDLCYRYKRKYKTLDMFGDE